MFNFADKLAIIENYLDHPANPDEKITLDDWQTQYLEATDRFLITNKSRRIGWSFVTALRGTVEMLDPDTTHYTKQYVSFSQDDAKEKINFAREFYYYLPDYFMDAHGNRIRKKKLTSEQRTVLEVEDTTGKTRSRLISLPCRPVRGRGGIVSLDEFAFHAKADLIYTSALPVISRGGSIEIGSTPFGNSGRFYEILNDKGAYPSYTRWNIPWYYSPALCNDVPGAILDILLPTEAKVLKYGTEILQAIFYQMPFEDFQQEYECSFRDDLVAFITLDMIRDCTPVGDDEILQFRSLEDFIINFDPKVHGDLYAGYDVGRTNDASELVIMGSYPEQKVRTVWATISYRKMEFSDQEDILLKMMHELPVVRLAIDQTGLGMQLAENLKKKEATASSPSRSRGRSRKSLPTPCGWGSTERNTCSRPTATYSGRFMPCERRSRSRLTLGSTWTKRRSTTATSFGAWRWPSTQHPGHGRARSTHSSPNGGARKVAR